VQNTRHAPSLPPRRCGSLQVTPRSAISQALATACARAKKHTRVTACHRTDGADRRIGALARKAFMYALSSLPKRSRPRRHGVDALHPVELRHSAAQKLFATRSVRRRTRQSPRSIIAVASIAKFHTAPDRGSPRNRHRVAPIQCRADTTAPCARRGLPRDLR